MTIAERNKKLKHFIACLKCEISGKLCDDNCPTQYDAGNMGEIIENLEAISRVIEQEHCGDCISRKAVLEIIEKEGFKGDALSEIEKLSPVTPQPNNVLDKIRTEIEQIARPNELGCRGNGKSIRTGLCIALSIIDKYKAESEDGEQNE